MFRQNSASYPSPIKTSFATHINGKLPRHLNAVSAIELDRVSGRLYTGSRDAKIGVWDSTTTTEQLAFIQGLEHHVHWVNDIKLCRGGRNLISASSDRSIKVWNVHRGYCAATVFAHADQVQTLAYAKDAQLLASAGLDQNVLLWDVGTLTVLGTADDPGNATVTGLPRSQFSIYSLAMNPEGTIVVSGSMDDALRIRDTRTGQQIAALKGHRNNVKALALSDDGRQLVSGCSDGTIKLWNVGERRCVETLGIHSQGVWCLLMTENFTHIISGSRDRKIMMTEIRNPANRMLVGFEQAPVLSLCYNSDRTGVWASTWKSDFYCWSLNRKEQ